MAYPNTAPKRYKKLQGTAKPKYSENVVKRMYEAGLSDNMNYYFAAFHLGRYLRHSVGLDEAQALIELTIWLKRHFLDICQTQGLTPFVRAYTSKTKDSYSTCEANATQNFLNGFWGGKPFMQRVRILPRRASNYLNKLGYNERQAAALHNLLDYAVKRKTLDVYLSYPKLLSLFNVAHRQTVSKWLKRFNEDGVFIPLNKETRHARQPMQYHLYLPETCYRVL
jgi:hypothetical protein